MIQCRRASFPRGDRRRRSAGGDPSPATAHSSAPKPTNSLEAEARAEAARARAIRLRSKPRRRQATTRPAGAERSPSRRRRAGARLRRPTEKSWPSVAAVVVICASLAGSGYLVWHHRNVVQQRQRTRSSRGRPQRHCGDDDDRCGQGKGQDAAFVDDTTGMFKISILMGAEDVVKALEQSKVSSKGRCKPSLWNP